ncbi:MAG: hypothetical protein CM15mP98_10430 [Paracoccaceae bacterium]|nr:MAG: hypothetical protein CM15mP98_10430 [Paracoccaceae bacterium]
MWYVTQACLALKVDLVEVIKTNEEKLKNDFQRNVLPKSQTPTGMRRYLESLYPRLCFRARRKITLQPT